MDSQTDYEPLATACAKARVPYIVGWRAATAGRIPAARDGRARWYVRVEDLRRLVERVPVVAA